MKRKQQQRETQEAGLRPMVSSLSRCHRFFKGFIIKVSCLLIRSPKLSTENKGVRSRSREGGQESFAGYILNIPANDS